MSLFIKTPLLVPPSVPSWGRGTVPYKDETVPHGTRHCGTQLVNLGIHCNCSCSVWICPSMEDTGRNTKAGTTVHRKLGVLRQGAAMSAIPDAYITSLLHTDTPFQAQRGSRDKAAYMSSSDNQIHEKLSSLSSVWNRANLRERFTFFETCRLLKLLMSTCVLSPSVAVHLHRRRINSYCIEDRL
ncbi:hypothetical protein C8J55DRAFT_92162 [Lentinula edodes]|uniref:Uncharacterized protein n=1 Tax=Lentinula lateritia TaxID=40482 RepID=A0A9W9DLU3_9AGAR|nr:hypothetical protein C8J55DRAFT_92162 [Lentinula edodes]